MISDSSPPPKTRRLGKGASSTSTGASSTSTGEPTRGSLVASGKVTADPWAWVKAHYRVPVNAELHYNHMLAWNGVVAHQDSSFTSDHVKDIFKLACAALKFAKANYTPGKGFLTPSDFAAALRAELKAETENQNREAGTVSEKSEELMNFFLGNITGPQHKALYFAISWICCSRDALTFLGTRIAQRSIKHFNTSIQSLNFNPDPGKPPLLFIFAFSRLSLVLDLFS